MDAFTGNLISGVVFGMGLQAIFSRRRTAWPEQVALSALAVGLLLALAALWTDDWRETASVGVFALMLTQLAGHTRRREAGRSTPGWLLPVLAIAGACAALVAAVVWASI